MKQVVYRRRMESSAINQRVPRLVIAKRHTTSLIDACRSTHQQPANINNMNANWTLSARHTTRSGAVQQFRSIQHMSNFTITPHTTRTQHTRDRPAGAERGRHNDLCLHVNQYVPKDNPSPKAGDVTLIGAHANGFPKELYEPFWDDLYERLRAKGRGVRGIWIADIASQGQSGILNEEILGPDGKLFLSTTHSSQSRDQSWLTSRVDLDSKLERPRPRPPAPHPHIPGRYAAPHHWSRAQRRGIALDAPLPPAPAPPHKPSPRRPHHPTRSENPQNPRQTLHSTARHLAFAESSSLKFQEKQILPDLG